MINRRIYNGLKNISRGYSNKVDSREYFYFIDVHGQLFLMDTKPKNFTTCFKDTKFLNFFFKRLTINNLRDPIEYPYLSPCGKEFNFIKVEDTPIVFKDIDEQGNLIWGGNLKFPMDPKKLYVSKSNGRVYHSSPLASLIKDQNIMSSHRNHELALLKSSLILSKLVDSLDLDAGIYKDSSTNQKFKLNIVE